MPDPLRDLIRNAESLRVNVAAQIDTLLTQGAAQIEAMAPRLPVGSPEGGQAGAGGQVLPEPPRIEEVLAMLPELPRLPGAGEGGSPSESTGKVEKESLTPKGISTTTKFGIKEA